MKALIKSLVASLFLVCMLGGASAHTHESASDSTAIVVLMNSLWDAPGNPLAVEPVVLSGDYALAGWTQSGHGGRALLHKEHGQWKIVVCGGDNLKVPDVLMSTGMDHHTAHSLAEGIKQAEGFLPQETLRLFASFEGLVTVDSAHVKSEQATHEHAH